MMPAAIVSSNQTVLDISVDIQGSEWTNIQFDLVGLCRSAAREAVSSAKKISGHVEISIVLAGDDFVQGLNRNWRHIDSPTNVLAFPCSADADPIDGEQLLGDVIVADQTTRREAAELGLPLEHHVAHLIIHGVLHLLGYDHMNDADAEEMEHVEILALANLGIESPYQEDGPDG